MGAFSTVILLSAWLFAPAALATPSIQYLQLPPGTIARAHGMSSDGRYVVGATQSNLPVRWDVQTGAVTHLFGSGSIFYGLAITAANNGVVAGETYISGTDTFRWSPETLGQLVQFGFPVQDSSPRDISSDGSVIVGHSVFFNAGPYTAGPYAYRWEQSTGMVGIVHGAANAVTPDGVTVVGQRIFGPSDQEVEAFRWTADEGVQNLGLLDGYLTSSAMVVSDDGGVIAGRAGSNTDGEVFLWTEDAGVIGLGNLGGRTAEPTAMSGDGDLIVGTTSSGPFIWDPTNGMRLLRAFMLDELGLDLDGVILDSAVGMSSDGTWIAGTARIGGNPTMFFATIPEPSTAALIVVGLFGYATIARWRRFTNQ